MHLRRVELRPLPMYRAQDSLGRRCILPRHPPLGRRNQEPRRKMNTEQRLIPSKQIATRTLTLRTVIATVLIGGLPGTAYCGEYLDNWLAGRGGPFAYDDAHYIHGDQGPIPLIEASKFPSGEILVESRGAVPNHGIATWYDQYGKIEYQRDCCFCN